MDDWVLWLILAVVFAVGAGAAALTALAGGGGVVQLVVFLAVTGAVFSIVRPIARGHMTTPPQIRTGTAALVGRPAVVLERIANDEGAGCVKIDGEVWTARSYMDDEIIEAGARVHVLEIRGATALVSE